MERHFILFGRRVINLSRYIQRDNCIYRAENGEGVLKTRKNRKKFDQSRFFIYFFSHILSPI